MELRCCCVARWGLIIVQPPSPSPLPPLGENGKAWWFRGFSQGQTRPLMFVPIYAGVRVAWEWELFKIPLRPFAILVYP